MRVMQVKAKAKQHHKLALIRTKTRTKAKVKHLSKQHQHNSLGVMLHSNHQYNKLRHKWHLLINHSKRRVQLNKLRLKLSLSKHLLRNNVQQRRKLSLNKRQQRLMSHQWILMTISRSRSCVF